eukprot:6394332-Pyramimonas_sp.AAC.1
MGPSRDYTRASRVRWVRRETIPARPASDGSIVRLYPRVPRPMGPSRDYTRGSCVRWVHRKTIPARPASDGSV